MLFRSCSSGISFVSEISQNAPFGIGTLIKTIEYVFTNIQQADDNNIKVKQILKDIISLLDILKNISNLSATRFSHMVLCINTLKEDIESFNEIYEKISNSNKVKLCIFSMNYKSKLQDIITRISISKSTINLSLTACLNQNNNHIIPYTNVKAACPCLKPDSDKPNQCMIINKSTDARCSVMFPNYKLVSIKGEDNEKIVYYTCGRCAPNRGNTWWKKEYKRFEV